MNIHAIPGQGVLHEFGVPISARASLFFDRASESDAAAKEASGPILGGEEPDPAGGRGKGNSGSLAGDKGRRPASPKGR